MKPLLVLRSSQTISSVTAVVGATVLGLSVLAGAPVAKADSLSAVQPADVQNEQVLLRGSTTGSYFWDDGSGLQGDTGLPAIGKPMQEGLFASPSWPLGTEGYVTYNGKKARFFIGDRGPGTPSEDGVMLDIDGKTFAQLTGSTWNSDTLTVGCGQGHIEVEYVVTKWGSGPGKKGAPVPFSSGEWSN